MVESVNLKTEVSVRKADLHIRVINHRIKQVGKYDSWQKHGGIQYTEALQAGMAKDEKEFRLLSDELYKKCSSKGTSEGKRTEVGQKKEDEENKRGLSPTRRLKNSDTDKKESSIQRKATHHTSGHRHGYPPDTHVIYNHSVHRKHTVHRREIPRPRYYQAKELATVTEPGARFHCDMNNQAARMWALSQLGPMGMCPRCHTYHRGPCHAITHTHLVSDRELTSLPIHNVSYSVQCLHQGFTNTCIQPGHARHMANHARYECSVVFGVCMHVRLCIT